jgi:hypothetical protein
VRIKFYSAIWVREDHSACGLGKSNIKFRSEESACLSQSSIPRGNVLHRVRDSTNIRQTNTRLFCNKTKKCTCIKGFITLVSKMFRPLLLSSSGQDCESAKNAAYYQIISLTHGYDSSLIISSLQNYTSFKFKGLRASSFTKVLEHTQRRTTVVKTPLDEWSARRRDLNLTTHNRQTYMSPVGFEPTISAGERLQAHALDRAVTGTGLVFCVLCTACSAEKLCEQSTVVFCVLLFNFDHARTFGSQFTYRN